MAWSTKWCRDNTCVRAVDNHATAARCYGPRNCAIAVDVIRRTVRVRRRLWSSSPVHSKSVLQPVECIIDKTSSPTCRHRADNEESTRGDV